MELKRSDFRALVLDFYSEMTYFEEQLKKARTASHEATKAIVFEWARKTKPNVSDFPEAHRLATKAGVEFERAQLASEKTFEALFTELEIARRACLREIAKLAPHTEPVRGKEWHAVWKIFRGAWSPRSETTKYAETYLTMNEEIVSAQLSKTPRFRRSEDGVYLVSQVRVAHPAWALVIKFRALADEKGSAEAFTLASVRWCHANRVDPRIYHVGLHPEFEARNGIRKCKKFRVVRPQRGKMSA